MHTPPPHDNTYMYLFWWNVSLHGHFYYHSKKEISDMPGLCVLDV